MAYPSVSALFIDSNEIACIWSQQDLTETSAVEAGYIARLYLCDQ